MILPEELTDEQRAVRDAPQSSRLLIAPPGAGKTEALALRASGFVQRREVGYPYRILAVTFSNRARDNLAERIRAHLGARTFRESVTVVNLHGLAARVYRSHSTILGHEPSEMKAPQRGWLDEKLRERQVQGSERSRIKSILQTAKQEPIDDDVLLDRLYRADRSEVAVEIEEDRQREKLLDFADLVRHAQRILAIDAVAQLYREHFYHVLVDEFQDVTLQQAAIVKSISGRNVTWAGDIGQAIYSFTGADPSNLESNLRASVDKVHVFHRTHRSPPAVVDVLNAIGAELRLPSLECARPEEWPDGGGAFALVFPDRETEASFLVFAAEEIMADDPSATIGVIVRVGFRRTTIDEQFRGTFSGRASFWSSALTSSRTARLLTDAYKSMDLDVLDGSQAVSELLQHTMSMVEDDEVDCLDELRLCVNWLHDALESGLSFAEALAQVRVSDDPNSPIPPGVHLLNAHVGKGLEFDHVFVCGLEKDILPIKQARSGDEIREELRVLRVMISRSRKTCTITRTRSRQGYNGPIGVSPSPWWRLVAEACHF